MALYSDFRYAIHIKFILGYLAMFLACLALICALSSYTSCFLRLDDLGRDIGSLCFRAYLSILPGHPKGGGPGGAKVVTSYAGMVPGYAGSLGYDGAPRFDWGRPQVVTALSVCQEAASRLAYSPTFGYRVGVHAKMKRDWMFSSAGHSPRCP
jgi:hypothetical protein